MESSRNKPRTLAIILGAAITDLQNHGKAKSGEASERAFNAAIDTVGAVAEELKNASFVADLASLCGHVAGTDEEGADVLCQKARGHEGPHDYAVFIEWRKGIPRVEGAGPS